MSLLLLLDDLPPIQTPRRRTPTFRPRRGTCVTPPSAAAAPSVPPSLRALGTVVATTTSGPSFAAPAGTISTDVVLALMFVDAGTTTVTGVPTGFTVIPGLPQDSNPSAPATDHSLVGYWGRFSAIGAGPYVFTLSASVFVEGRCAAIQDCITTGSPWEATNGNTSGPSSSVTTAPAVSATSLAANRYAFYAATNWSGGAWTPPSGFVEKWDANDEVITFDDKSLPTAQTVSPQAVCASSARSNAWVGILLPTSTPAAAVIPPVPLRRRPVPVRPRRGIGDMTPPFVDQTIPGGQAQRGRLKWPRPFRSRVTNPVPAQVAAAPPVYAPASVRTRLRGLRIFRARTAGPILDQALIPATSGRRVKIWRPFRARTVMPAPDQIPAPAGPRPRFRSLRLTRGRTVAPVPPQIVVTPPAYTPQAVRLRLRGLRLFRPSAVSPVPAQIVVTPPAYPPQPVRTRLRGLRLFRPRTASPVPAQIIITPPAYPPANVRIRLRGLRLFRARAATPVPDQVLPIPPSRPSRIRGLLPRRARAATPVPAQIVIAPPAYPPQSVRTKLRGLRLFRGRTSSPVPAQQAAVVTPYVLQSVRSRLKGLRWLRGRAAAPPLDQTPTPTAPHPRAHPMPVRRARAAGPPVPQAAPPASQAPQARQRLKAFRSRPGKTVVPVPPNAVPPLFVPMAVRLKLRAARIFRGAVRPGWLVSVPPRTPTVTVELARVLVLTETARVAVVDETSRVVVIADLSRVAIAEELARTVTTVAL